MNIQLDQSSMNTFTRHRFIYVILLSIAVGAVGGALVARYTSQRAFLKILRSQTTQQHLQKLTSKSKFETTLQLIDGIYVDSVAIDTLVESMMPKLVEWLDPHSAYIPAKDMSRVNEALDGEFDGIGVVFNMATDTVIVLNVIAAGPSSKAGIMARDRIITIDGEVVAGVEMRQDSVVGRLRGPRGTKVLLGIERGDMDDLVEIEVTRGKIPIHSISSSFMIADSVGYIRLEQFARTTHKEFTSAIERLLKSGMSSLILDLRGNTGGYMDQAILLSNEFLPDKTLIVYTEDRTGKQEKQYSNRNGRLQDLPLVVLVDEGSASSSEIVAGALQDNDKGTIIGRRTFGKGLVQQQIPFADGSALRLTVARYYTPTGRSIQKPYTMGGGEEYDRELAKRVEHDELITADSILFNDSLRHVTPGGRVVYGGGGIMPDIFIPLSTEKLPQFFIDVTGRNILYKYTIDFSDRHRDALAKVETVEDLNRLFDGEGDRLFSDFVKYAASKDIKAESDEDLEASRDIIEKQIRAFVGRNTTLGDDGYYASIHTLDDALTRAIKELQ